MIFIKNTKERILDAALELFSINGYEATSVEEIAAMVGIKAPSIYKHYKNKEEIFTELTNLMVIRYENNSIFKKEYQIDFSLENAIDLVEKQFHFSLTDPYVSKYRRLLTIEQFRNDKAKKIQSERSYYDILSFYERIFNKQIIAGKIEKIDCKILSLEFISPISLLLSQCDRNNELEEEALIIIRKHIHLFFEKYIKN
ncbi:MAG: TetR/AcrR family transcriptional regulator [Anaeroplasma sp.]